MKLDQLKERFTYVPESQSGFAIKRARYSLIDDPGIVVFVPSDLVNPESRYLLRLDTESLQLSVPAGKFTELKAALEAAISVPVCFECNAITPKEQSYDCGICGETYCTWRRVAPGGNCALEHHVEKHPDWSLKEVGLQL